MKRLRLRNFMGVSAIIVYILQVVRVKTGFSRLTLYGKSFSLHVVALITIKWGIVLSGLILVFLIDNYLCSKRGISEQLSTLESIKWAYYVMCILAFATLL